VDFYRSIERFAGNTGGTVGFIEQPRVQASSRRFDKWPLWKTLLWTNRSSSRCSVAARRSGRAGIGVLCA